MFCSLSFTFGECWMSTKDMRWLEMTKIVQKLLERRSPEQWRIVYNNIVVWTVFSLSTSSQLFIIWLWNVSGRCRRSERVKDSYGLWQTVPVISNLGRLGNSQEGNKEHLKVSLVNRLPLPFPRWTTQCFFRALSSCVISSQCNFLFQLNPRQKAQSFSL